MKRTRNDEFKMNNNKPSLWKMFSWINVKWMIQLIEKSIEYIRFIQLTFAFAFSKSRWFVNIDFAWKKNWNIHYNDYSL